MNVKDRIEKETEDLRRAFPHLHPQHMAESAARIGYRLAIEALRERPRDPRPRWVTLSWAASEEADYLESLLEEKP